MASDLSPPSPQKRLTPPLSLPPHSRQCMACKGHLVSETFVLQLGVEDTETYMRAAAGRQLGTDEKKVDCPFCCEYFEVRGSRMERDDGRCKGTSALAAMVDVPTGRDWSQPLAPGEGRAVEYEPVLLTSGSGAWQVWDSGDGLAFLFCQGAGCGRVTCFHCKEEVTGTSPPLPLVGIAMCAGGEQEARVLPLKCVRAGARGARGG
jgi:hypothetical protein